jgi:hypothetical protein
MRSWGIERGECFIASAGYRCGGARGRATDPWGGVGHSTIQKEPEHCRIGLSGSKDNHRFLTDPFLGCAVGQITDRKEGLAIGWLHGGAH